MIIFAFLRIFSIWRIIPQIVHYIFTKITKNVELTGFLHDKKHLYSVQSYYKKVEYGRMK